jgi:hypothetical protein
VSVPGGWRDFKCVDGPRACLAPRAPHVESRELNSGVAGAAGKPLEPKILSLAWLLDGTPGPQLLLTFSEILAGLVHSFQPLHLSLERALGQL